MTPDPWPRITAALASAAWALPVTPRGERPTLPPGALINAASELPPILLALASGRAQGITATQREAHIADAVVRLVLFWHLYGRQTSIPFPYRHPQKSMDVHIARGARAAWSCVQDPDPINPASRIIIEELAVAIGAAVHQYDTARPSCSAAEALDALANALPLVTP